MDGILIRATKEAKQIQLPATLKNLMYIELHHKTENRERVFWPGMKKDIHHYIAKQWYCFKMEKPHCPLQAPLGTITTSKSLEIIGTDFLHFKTSSGGYQYMLVLTDIFINFLRPILHEQVSQDNIRESFEWIFYLFCHSDSYSTWPRERISEYLV